MIIYNTYCFNEDCDLYSIKQEIESEKTDELFCECGSKLKIVGQKTFGGFLRFDSRSSDEKKAMMKKRYREHSNKEVKDKVHEVRKSILGENYKLIPKGQ